MIRQFSGLGGEIVKYLLFIILAGFILSMDFERLSRADMQKSTQKQFTISPIGQIKKNDGRTMIVLEKKYQTGLEGLDSFSHVYVFYWFDRNDTPPKRSILRVHPQGNKSNPLSGVFATRAPVRPNLIAMSLCKVISVLGNIIEIDQIDAFPETPVLDLKPYIPGIDTAEVSTIPEWLRRKKR